MPENIYKTNYNNDRKYQGPLKPLKQKLLNVNRTIHFTSKSNQWTENRTQWAIQLNRSTEDYGNSRSASYKTLITRDRNTKTGNIFTVSLIKVHCGTVLKSARALLGLPSRSGWAGSGRSEDRPESAAIEQREKLRCFPLYQDKEYSALMRTCL